MKEWWLKSTLDMNGSMFNNKIDDTELVKEEYKRIKKLEAERKKDTGAKKEVRK